MHHGRVRVADHRFEHEGYLFAQSDHFTGAQGMWRTQAHSIDECPVG